VRTTETKTSSNNSQLNFKKHETCFILWRSNLDKFRKNNRWIWSPDGGYLSCPRFIAGFTWGKGVNCLRWTLWASPRPIWQQKRVGQGSGLVLNWWAVGPMEQGLIYTCLCCPDKQCVWSHLASIIVVADCPVSVSPMEVAVA
jgi:hypothetical protein